MTEPTAREALTSLAEKFRQAEHEASSGRPVTYAPGMQYREALEMTLAHLRALDG